jgi:hypothetical protein
MFFCISQTYKVTPGTGLDVPRWLSVRECDSALAQHKGNKYHSELTHWFRVQLRIISYMLTCFERELETLRKFPYDWIFAELDNSYAKSKQRGVPLILSQRGNSVPYIESPLNGITLTLSQRRTTFPLNEKWKAFYSILILCIQSQLRITKNFEHLGGFEAKNLKNFRILPSAL